ncbi:hypothetical protein LEP1GSC161_1934 [Leptospira santarosai str. CBC1416]|uniref:Uncharacterized protein n=1 Tax=Leptospira santarosai str. CBC1416 TaxID=1193059 RepID=M6VLN3_9LEPT|nr:hypothetical protein LEP1GSC161_1934 [Leptospira santarosai str. CBC1416]
MYFCLVYYFYGIKTCWEFKSENYIALFQLAFILFRMSRR